MDQKPIEKVIQDVMQLRMGLPDRLHGWNFEADPKPELLQILANDNYGIKIRQIWFSSSVRQSVVYGDEVVFENDVSLTGNSSEASHYIPGTWEQEVRRIHLRYMRQERRG